MYPLGTIALYQLDDTNIRRQCDRPSDPRNVPQGPLPVKSLLCIRLAGCTFDLRQ